MLIFWKESHAKGLLPQPVALINLRDNDDTPQTLVGVII